MDFLYELSENLNDILLQIGLWGPVIACLFIVVESIIPILPLSVFITVNFIVFGSFIGFIISWIFTIIGCIISFMIFKHRYKEKFEKKIRNKKYVEKLIVWLETAKFQHLVVLVAIPFTPAFLFNIAAGLSKMTFRKFFFVILIGKIFLIYFWGFVGTALLESLTNPVAMVRVIVLTLIAYLLSSFVNKKFGLD